MKRILFLICNFSILVMVVVTAQAKIISVDGPVSWIGNPYYINGPGPSIIPAPSDILDDCVTNSSMQGFDEVQGVTTTIIHDTDNSQIPVGTTVSSHMIFLNSEGLIPIIHNNVIWTFDQPVIGVMSDTDGILEAASTFELGAPGTNYTILPTGPDTTPCGSSIYEQAAPFGARGLENSSDCSTNSDGYLVSGNTIQVCMYAQEPGDWIRVITLAIIDIDIDIKPGSDPNSINLCSNGVVPIAIMGSTSFDVYYVNTDTLRFAEAAVKVVGKKDPQTLCNYEDVNGDSIDDLVCHFLTADIAGVDGESTSATVNGELVNGTPIEGVDSINIVKDTCN